MINEKKELVLTGAKIQLILDSANKNYVKFEITSV
jgi:hypothetical protein